MSSSPDTATQRKLSKYRIVRRIAVGGMGELFLAREEGVAAMGRAVVVKQLLPELADEPELVAHFVDEARIAAQLVHPNVVHVYDFGREADTYFLAMEYVPGLNLAKMMSHLGRAGRRLPIELAMHVVAELVRALDYAHTATDADGAPLDLVHRDISPHNVLVSVHGDVKLLDFGIARASIRRQRTQTGLLRGKFAYMSPEQASQAPLDARSDLFSVGIVLWEATLMRRLFTADTEIETLSLVQACDIPKPTDIDPAYPGALEDIVLRALSPDPDERFQSAAELHAALLQVARTLQPVDKRALGALVTDLDPTASPLESDSEEATGTAPLANRAPSMLESASAAASPEVADAVATSGAEPAARSGRSWPLIVAMLLAVFAIGGGTVWYALRAPDRQGEAAANNMADASTVLAADAARVGTAESSAFDAGAAHFQPPDASVSARPTQRSAPASVRGPKSTRPRVRPAPLPDAAVRAARPAPRPANTYDAAPSALPKPNPGTLVVSSSPYGTVRINGARHGHTDLFKRLAPGRYRVSVQLSDGSGTFATTAVLEEGKKTKCRVRQRALVCQSPR